MSTPLVGSSRISTFGSSSSQRAMMIFCCMPPEKFSRLASASRSGGSSSRCQQVAILAVERAIAEAEAAMRAEMAEQQVLAHGKVGHDALPPPILGDKADARRGSPAAGERGANGLPLEADLAARAWAQAEQRLHRLRAAGADEAAEPENLAAMQIERDVAHQRRRAADGAPTGSGSPRVVDRR